MSNRDKSILAQVAFKAAVEVTGGNDIDELFNTSLSFNEVLVKLHETLGISLDEKDSRGGGQKPVTTLPEGAFTFVLDGIEWIAYETAKDKGTVNAKFPEFKTFDKSIPQAERSVWMYDKEGNPNTAAAPLVEASRLAAQFA